MKTVTRREAAALVGVSEVSIGKWIKQGKLREHEGKISMNEVTAFVENRERILKACEALLGYSPVGRSPGRPRKTPVTH